MYSTTPHWRAQRPVLGDHPRSRPPPYTSPNLEVHTGNLLRETTQNANRPRKVQRRSTPRLHSPPPPGGPCTSACLSVVVVAERLCCGDQCGGPRQRGLEECGPAMCARRRVQKSLLVLQSVRRQGTMRYLGPGLLCVRAMHFVS